MNKRRHASTRLLLAPIALSAFVATWGGWVGLAGLTGFGEVNLLPGIIEPDLDGTGGTWSTVNLAIALPLGVEAYAAYAMSVWFGTSYSRTAKRFAAVSAVFSLLLAAAGQIAYHVLVSKHVTNAPDWLTAFVACLPVIVIGMAAALLHLTGQDAGDVSETTAGTKPETPWGRLRDAATGAAVARLNRTAETPRDVSEPIRDPPAETPTPSRDVPLATVPPVSETASVPDGTPHETRPAPSQKTRETAVSAAQEPNVATKPSRDDQIRMVHEMRQETPRPSYAVIAERLSISKAEAGRLGQEAAKRFGETTPILHTAPFPLPSRDAETVTASPLNGSTYPTQENQS